MDAYCMKYSRRDSQPQSNAEERPPQVIPEDVLNFAERPGIESRPLALSAAYAAKHSELSVPVLFEKPAPAPCPSRVPSSVRDNKEAPPDAEKGRLQEVARVWCRP